VFALISFCTLSAAIGDPVYKKIDPVTGQTTYSSGSSPAKKGATPAQLPEIMKGDFQAPAQKKKGLRGCLDHGGFNCKGGPDKDGSVVCANGFRDADLLYRYTCPHPKLEVIEVIQKAGAPGATLVIRNVRQITAHGLSVRLRSGSNPPLKMKGPETLEEGALGVFEVFIPKGVLPGGAQTLTRNQLLITCGNCG
jgi:hypothetical protein